MKIVNPNSMFLTLDALNSAFFYGTPLAGKEKVEAAKWIAARQGLVYGYAGMPAPMDMDYREGGIRLFTGEPVRSGAATGHILGEEALRALILLDVQDESVRRALDMGTRGMMKRLLLPSGEPNPDTMGMYCCGTCSAAYWRHLAVGGLREPERRLDAGMKALKDHRLGNGQWRRFPFYYTLLALSEIALPAAMEEMRYAAPVLERYVKRRTADDVHERRRHTLAERILSRL